MFCKHCGKNPNFEYTLSEWVTYLRGKYKDEWEVQKNDEWNEIREIIKNRGYLADENTWFPSDN